MPALNHFIEAELERLEAARIEHVPRSNVIDRLNDLFKATVKHQHVD